MAAAPHSARPGSEWRSSMPSAPRCVALVGPYLSGKTTLLEALLFASGTTSRRGSVRDGSSVGDHAAEARARQMSTEISTSLMRPTSATPADDRRLPGLSGAPRRGAAGDAGRRCRRRGVRARGRARDHGERAPALPVAPQHSAHALHQQARRCQRPGARRARGIAGGVGPPAGAAPGAAARRGRRDHRAMSIS